MKKFFIIYIILFCSMISFGQLSPQNIWYAAYSSNWSFNTYYQRYSIDTTSIFINNEVYQQILTSTDSIGDNWIASQKYIRQANGKLWVIDSTNNVQEQCIMDMNLKKGEVFPYLDGAYGSARGLLVTDVDSITDMSGQIRKVIFLSCEADPVVWYVWIEGIGPDVGIFSTTFHHCVIDGNENSLTCVYNNGVQIWHNENFDHCWKSSHPVVTQLMPILDSGLIRYVSTYDFFSGKTTMERWKFESLPEVFNAGKAYFELLVSDEKDGNNFSGSGRFFREQDNRFYQYISPTEGERLLYDMNLNLGDSIQINYEDDMRDMVVIKEDSVTLLDQKIRKRLTLQCVIDGELADGNTAEWIEGIGRFFEPFVDYSHCSIWDIARPDVVCIFDGEEHIFKKELAPDDCWIKPQVFDTTDIDHSTIWYSSSYVGNWSDGDCRKKIDITKVVRNTLIGFRLCHIMGVSSGNTYFAESELPFYSKDGKMYFYEDNSWKLLYDFTAQIGDTVTYHISKKYPYYAKYGLPAPFNPELINDNPYQLVIKNIDTIYDNSGKPLKRFFTERIFNVHGHFMGEIIENIGSKEKLFGNNYNIIPPQCSPFEESVGLRCYSNDDTSIKFTEGECDKITKTNDISDFKVNLFPNPGHDKISIHLDSGLVLPISYRLTDISGRIIFKDVVQLTNFDIHTSHLTSGLYIITISDSQGKISSGKWVKE